MDESEAREVVTKFLSQIKNQPGWRLDQWPGWYHEAISALALLVDNADVEYVTGEFEGGQGAAQGVLHLYTPDLVITVSVATNAEDGTASTATARRRAQLVSLDVSASGSVGGGGAAFNNWPLHAQAVAHYEDGHVITAPTTRATSAEARDQFLAFLPSLRRDLLESTTEP